MHLRSADALFTNVDGSIRLNLPAGGVRGVSSMVLLDMGLPASFFSFAGGTIIVDITTYTIPPGNYTAASLAAALTTLLAGINGTVTYSSDLNSLQITTPSAHTIAWAGTANSLLGLSTTASLSVPAATVTTFPGAPNMFGTREVFVNFSGMSGQFLSTSGVAAHWRLPLSGGANSLTFYDASTSVYNQVSFPKQDVSFLTVRLMDNGGNLLDFRGHSWSMTVLFQ